MPKQYPKVRFNWRPKKTIDKNNASPPPYELSFNSQEVIKSSSGIHPICLVMPKQYQLNEKRLIEIFSTSTAESSTRKVVSDHNMSQFTPDPMSDVDFDLTSNQTDEPSSSDNYFNSISVQSAPTQSGNFSSLERIVEEGKNIYPPLPTREIAEAIYTLPSLYDSTQYQTTNYYINNNYYNLQVARPKILHSESVTLMHSETASSIKNYSNQSFQLSNSNCGSLPPRISSTFSSTALPNYGNALNLSTENNVNVNMPGLEAINYSNRNHQNSEASNVKKHIFTILESNQSQINFHEPQNIDNSKNKKFAQVSNKQKYNLNSDRFTNITETKMKELSFNDLTRKNILPKANNSSQTSAEKQLNWAETLAGCQHYTINGEVVVPINNDENSQLQGVIVNVYQKTELNSLLGNE